MLRVSSLYRLLRQLEHVSLFSACFLAAVTQHAGCSHIIIGEEGGKNGNPWQLMQGLSHARPANTPISAGGSSSCQFLLIFFLSYT